MTLLALLSATSLTLFAATYLYRLLYFRFRRHIQANTMGQSGKSMQVRQTEWLLWLCTLSFMLSWALSFLSENRWIWSRFFLLPLNLYPFSFAGFRYTGLILCWLGVLLFIVSVLNMRGSWRVGIDTKTDIGLVTDGLFYFSRNPIYVGFRFIFCGAFLTFPSVLLAMLTIANLILMHRLTLYEEAFLKQRFGRVYQDYYQSTPRYLLPRLSVFRESRDP